ncbi:MAG TPA: FIST N-terminal domain-containing protein [Actinomycetota bacterium]|nr:FIST N-terminal domain-containing protein [Actinomycetota bacterium]
MRFGAALSEAPAAARAGAEAAREAAARLGAAPSLAVVFASPHHADEAAELLAAVREAAGVERAIGCVAEAVVGGPREVEGGPAVAVWLAELPGEVRTFGLGFARTSEGGVLHGHRLEPGPRAHLLIADPYTFPADLFLRFVDERLPGTVVMGGMASGGAGPGETRLFLDGEVRREGAVGAALDVDLRPLVSQGCRPVGSPYTVTAARGNVVLELGGEPPLRRLTELLERLPPEDAELVRRGVQVGLVIDEYVEDPGPGDHLIRGVLGFDPDSGAMAVGEQVEVGRTLRFHVRDARTADRELREALERERERLGRAPAGALLFTCNGRGRRMFGVPDHDAGLVSDVLGGPPLAGSFCAGEIGPVGGRNFLHGFTASLALFAEDAPGGGAAPGPA